MLQGAPMAPTAHALNIFPYPWCIGKCHDLKNEISTYIKTSFLKKKNYFTTLKPVRNCTIKL